MSLTDGRTSLVLVLLCTTLITTHAQDDDRCREKLSQDTIEYPGNNEDYKDDLNCTWVLSVESTSQRIFLRFTKFDLQEANEDGCPDYVEIWDGEIGSGKNLSGQLCGKLRDLKKNGNDVHNSTGNSILIRLITNGKKKGKGFKALYEEIEATTTDRQTTTTSSGATSTPPSTLATSEQSSPSATTTDRQTTTTTSGATSTPPSTLATSDRSSPNAGSTEPSTTVPIPPNPQRTTHVLVPSEPTPKATEGLDEPESQMAVTVVVGIVAVIVIIILVIIVGVCLRRSRRKAVVHSVQPPRDDSLYQSPVSDIAEHRDAHPPQFDNMCYLPVGIDASADHPFSGPADLPPPYESCLPANAVVENGCARTGATSGTSTFEGNNRTEIKTGEATGNQPSMQDKYVSKHDAQTFTANVAYASYDDDTGNNTTPEETALRDTEFERNVAYESYGNDNAGNTQVEMTPDGGIRGGKELSGNPGKGAAALPRDHEYYYVSDRSDKEEGFATNDAYESYEDAGGDYDGTLFPDSAFEDNVAYQGYEEQRTDDLPDVDKTTPEGTDERPEGDQGHVYSSVGGGDEQVEKTVAYESYDNAARTDDSDADGDYGHDYAHVGDGTEEEGFTTNVAYVGYSDNS